MTLVLQGRLELPLAVTAPGRSLPWLAGLLVYAAVVGFTPIILAALASRFFKPELLRPVPVP